MLSHLLCHHCIQNGDKHELLQAFSICTKLQTIMMSAVI